ncbi:hypothetical protein EVAR_52591_1 [Eumeta japonica]|uniref:Uncharacterized protein n=1 Tax=Eumeta variegata TaxID=151549 RepID=A0A4C1YPH1_EUMVA|nr:hypothetical protein EVAR_52591_1 [Eumeta japonica]
MRYLIECMQSRVCQRFLLDLAAIWSDLQLPCNTCKKRTRLSDAIGTKIGDRTDRAGVFFVLSLSSSSTSSGSTRLACLWTC